MFFTINSFFLFVSFFSMFFCDRVSSDKVPVAVWNIKGDAVPIEPVLNNGQDNTFKDILKVVGQRNASILVFAMKRLSLEDLSSDEGTTTSNNTLQNLRTFLNTQGLMFFSSVSDPRKQIHDNIHCDVQKIVVDQSVDDNVLQSISSAFDKSCVVILHISDISIVGVKAPTLQDIRKVFLPFDKSSKDIVGIFTAFKSSWGKSNEEHHIFRNLLETEEPAAPTSNFLNINDCLLMNANNATLLVKVGNKTVDLPFPVDSTGSECGNKSSMLVLNFKPTSEYSTVVISFNFSTNGLSWKTKTFLETTGSKDGDLKEEMDSKDLTAPLGFSWSCGRLDIKNLKKLNSTVALTVTFNKFQVQPFTVNSTGKFSDSFDCVPWFTVPIWMGIFVALLFISIINCGVYALFSVHTMDRFDDPKGKTISVAAATD